MVQIIDFSNSDTFSKDKMNLFLDKKLHVVCPAIKTNSYAVHFLTQAGMTVANLSYYCDKVNLFHDPGCLYPDYCFTLFPVYDKVYDKNEIRSNLKKYFIEVFKSNEDYFKTEIMMIAFDPESWSIIDVKVVLEELVSEKESEIKHLKTIYFLDNATNV